MGKTQWTSASWRRKELWTAASRRRTSIDINTDPKKTMQANGKKAITWMPWGKEEKGKDGPRQTAVNAISAMAKGISLGIAHHRSAKMANRPASRSAMDVTGKGIPKTSARQPIQVSKETPKEEAKDGRSKEEAAKDGKEEAAKDGKPEKGEKAGTRAAAKEARASTTSI